MRNLCDICNKNKAVIRINGSNNYCYDCHNAFMLERFCKEDTFVYPDKITVVDDNDESHILKVNHLILGGIVSWEANEVNGHYHFSEISELDESGYLVAKRFFHKITRGICTKSTDGNGIKSKGVMEIIEDKNSPSGIAFIIDGKKYNPNSASKLFSGFVGSNIVFQINDPSDELLDEDEYLVPVAITKDALIEELEIALACNTQSGFMSYKNVSAFYELYAKVYEKLEILKMKASSDKTLATAKEMARILYETESDDDSFPYDCIEDICELVDPFQVDNELWGYLKGL